jgi:spore maturation protein CgeB
VNAFLLEPARRQPRGRFVVAGPQYPGTESWPDNVTWQPHLPPAEHRAFYNSQRFTLNVTRRDMIAAGWSPSVRLFEAAACGTPILSDRWPGIESLLVPHQEILLVDRTADVLDILDRCREEERLRIAERARKRILAEHTAAHRAAELEGHAMELLHSVAA